MTDDLPEPIAHARPVDGDGFEIHPLPDHLRKVAALAGRFAKAFGNGDWAALAGQWHDLGKFRPRFQKYIRCITGYDVDAHIPGEAGWVSHSAARSTLYQLFGVVEHRWHQQGIDA